MAGTSTTAKVIHVDATMMVQIVYELAHVNSFAG